MKITALQLVIAYNHLFTIKKIPINDYNRYRSLRKIIKSLDDEYAIYQEKEQELVSQYATFNSDGKPDISATGRINFKSQFAEQEFIKAKTDINSEIIEINITPITITEDELKTIGLSYEGIEALEGIVNIEWGESDEGN